MIYKDNRPVFPNICSWLIGHFETSAFKTSSAIWRNNGVMFDEQPIYTKQKHFSEINLEHCFREVPLHTNLILMGSNPTRIRNSLTYTKMYKIWHFSPVTFNCTKDLSYEVAGFDARNHLKQKFEFMWWYVDIHINPILMPTVCICNRTTKFQHNTQHYVQETNKLFIQSLEQLRKNTQYMIAEAGELSVYWPEIAFTCYFDGIPLNTGLARRHTSLHTFNCC
jgi:hypothetical protein